jgi:CHASE3 domain sensor protein
MQSRAARLILLGLFLAAISTATFLFAKGNFEATNAALDAKAFDTSARAIERELLDLQAAQLGYAGAGQSGDRWVTRVAQTLEALRASLQALRAQTKTPEALAGLDATTVALNEFAKSDKRAAEYVRTDMRQLAGDVVFGDGIERTDAALASVEQVRLAELQAREALVETFRSRQIFALIAGAAASVLVVLLLVPRARSAPAAETLQASQTVEPEPTLQSVPQPEPMSVAEVATGPTDEALEPVLASLAQGTVETALPATTDFAGVASLCVDLARVVDTRALPSLLDRTASLLDASGIILWIADPDGRELNPIFAQGYPQQLVNRLGTIPRDAENATAAAFRTSLLQTVMADEISGGAIAAPLVTPGGCVGVMAAEVRNDSERQDAKLAAATIVAAQLATLVGPPSARPQSRSASSA